jgi:aryl-alcohol dehydrogenase-like predicted oxidoreductase
VARGEPGAGLGGEDKWKKFEAANLDELREEGESRTAFLLRFLIAHPDIHTTIVGTLHPEHLQENVANAEKGPLAPDTYAEVKRRLDASGETPAT